MVQKIVGLAGSTLSLVAAIIVIVVAVSENFVVVELPPIDKCSEEFLGTLGLFTATFDPACTVGSAVESSYSVFEKVTTPVTEFWPLFPAQEGFGGALSSVGLTKENFTTCEEFYADGGVFDVAAVEYATETVFSSLDTSLTSSYEEYASLLTIALDGVPTALSSYINDDFNSNVLSVESQIGGAAYLAHGVASTISSIQNAYCGASCSDKLSCTSTAACSSDAEVYLASDGLASGVNAGTIFTSSIAGSAGNYLSENFLFSIYAVYSGEASNFSSGLNLYDSITNTTVKDSGVTAGNAVMTTIASLYYGALSAEALSADNYTYIGSQIYGGVLTQYANGFTSTSFNLTSFIATVNTVSNSASDNSLVPAVGVLYYVCDSGVLDDCGTIDLTPFPRLNDTDPYPLCEAASGSDLFESTSIAGAAPADCTYLDLLKAVATEDVLSQLGATLLASYNLDESFLSTIYAALPAFQVILETGSQLQMTTTELKNYLLNPSGGEQGVVPEDLDSAGYALCGGIEVSGYPYECDSTMTFRSFINATYFNSAASDPSSSTTEGLYVANVIINSVCAAVSTRSGCVLAMAAALNYPTLDSLTSSLISEVETALPGTGSTRNETIADCNDDNTDREKFSQAQKILAASIAMMFVGVIVSVAAAFLNKTIVAVVGGAFSILGGVLLLAALLVVRSAPVYQEVGGTKVDYETYYAAYTGQIEALVGIALSVIGGIVVLVASCLARPSATEEALTTKVDTY